MSFKVLEPIPNIPMSSNMEVQQRRTIIPGHPSSDTDTRSTNSSRDGRHNSESISEIASTLSSSITTRSASSDTESISSLDLSPPQITIEVLESARDGTRGYHEEDLEPDAAFRSPSEDDDSDNSAIEYQDVDIYTDEASDGGSLQWDDRASISDTDAVYSLEEFDEEL